jgi:hypothetical protein
MMAESAPLRRDFRLARQTARSKRNSAEARGDSRRGSRAATITQGGQVDRSTAGRDDFPDLLRDIDSEHGRRGPREASGSDKRQPNKVTLNHGRNLMSFFPAKFEIRP